MFESFSQNGPPNYQKALGFSVKVDGGLRLCETSKKHWGKRFGASGKVGKIPYQT